MVRSHDRGGQRFVVTGPPAGVRPAAARAATAAVGLGLDPRRHVDVELAVHEALANAREHGHGGRDALPVDVEVAHDGVDRVVVRVTDRALGASTARAGRGAEDRGRGRTLMRAASDHLGVVAHRRATTVELGWDTVPVAAVRAGPSHRTR